MFPARGVFKGHLYVNTRNAPHTCKLQAAAHTALIDTDGVPCKLPSIVRPFHRTGRAALGPGMRRGAMRSMGTCPTDHDRSDRVPSSAGPERGQAQHRSRHRHGGQSRACTTTDGNRGF